MSSRAFFPVVAAAALLAFGVAHAAVANAQTQPAATNNTLAPTSGGGVPPLAWTDCGDGFQCGTVGVPLDYARAHARQIAIALIRRPALDAQARIGSLFIHPGGAGLGATFLRFYPPEFFQAFSRFDVIGFDVRGLGQSRPAVVACGRNPASVKPFPRAGVTDPHALVAAVREYVELCNARNGELLAHLSTANIARDLDRLRAAVGDRELNYLGISFGSVVGADYAALFPGRARAMLLDSPLDVQRYYDDPQPDLWARAQGHETALARFFVACRTAGARCGFGGGDPQGAFERLLAQLDQTPMPSPDPADPRLFSGDDLREVLAASIADSSYWGLLAAALQQAEDGDPRGLFAFLEGADDPAALAAQTMYEGMTSVDQRWPRASLRPYFDAAALAYQRLPHLFFVTGFADLIHGVWPARDAGAFRGRIRNPAYAAPILVVSSTHDAAAPYAQGQALVRDLGNARLLTRDFDGHGAILNPCVLDDAVRYFNTGQLPPRGKVCPQDDDPFPATAAAASGNADVLRVPMPRDAR